MISALARPAYVPRSSGATAGWRFVKPRTWVSYMIVFSQPVRDAALSPK